ncbi:MAG TPA: DUF2007 domain-containing protein [Symbiobacteriaceae bacterium]|jgi:hypothetical protein
MAASTDWEIVFQTGDQVEIEIIRGLLTTNGFPVVVEKKGLKGMSFMFGESAIGEYLLKVPPNMVDAALALLSADIEEPETEPESEK